MPNQQNAVIQADGDTLNLNFKTEVRIYFWTLVFFIFVCTMVVKDMIREIPQKIESYQVNNHGKTAK